jgi:glycosyltransferase involved in cell wall biosynthesis
MLITGLSGPGWDDRFNVWCFPDIFIGATKYQTNWAKKVNPFVKTVTIPYGASLDKFARTVKKLDLDLPRPIILSVGAFVPIKRHHLTIEAVSRLTGGSLVIAGSKGESENELQKLGNEKLSKRFKLMTISHDQIPLLYRSADLFVFPTSRWESFGIVLVEAMASGLPVVAADDPIRREIVGDAGLFVDPTNTNLYAETIEKALSTNWGNKPRKQAEKFDWKNIAEQYEKLFKDILK